MPFMEPEILHGHWYKMEGDNGTMYVWGMDVWNHNELDSYYDGTLDEEETTTVLGYGARLSAPGYMDCTDWCVFDTEKEASEYLQETYDLDENLEPIQEEV